MYCGWRKGTSLDKAMLNGEEIKPVTLYPLLNYVWLEASVRQSVSVE